MPGYVSEACEPSLRFDTVFTRFVRKDSFARLGSALVSGFVRVDSSAQFVPILGDSKQLGFHSQEFTA